MQQIRSDQISRSVVSNSATPWIAARQASLSITNSWSSPRLMSIKSVMPSSHLILYHPLLLLPPIPPSIRVFSNKSNTSHQVAKVLELQHQSFQWIFRVDFLSVQSSRSVVSDSSWPHESQHARPPCPSPTPRVHPNSRPSSRWCHPAISSSVTLFSSHLQSFPAS